MFLYILNGYEEGRFIKINSSRMEIGRSDNNDIVLPYDDKISRNHAFFIYEDDKLLIMDAESTHGTYLKQNKIKSLTRVSAGDVIILGDTLLLVSESKKNLPRLIQLAHS